MLVSYLRFSLHYLPFISVIKKIEFSYILNLFFIKYLFQLVFINADLNFKTKLINSDPVILFVLHALILLILISINTLFSLLPDRIP